MAKRRNLPDHRPPADDLESVRVFRDNLAALLAAAQNIGPRERCLTQHQFAKLVGMSLRNLRYLLEGKHAPTLRTIERAAAGLHLETWQLLIPDFPAELALNPDYRDQTQKVVRRYLSASHRVRSAIEELLPSPPLSHTAQ